MKARKIAFEFFEYRSRVVFDLRMYPPLLLLPCSWFHGLRLSRDVHDMLRGDVWE